MSEADRNIQKPSFSWQMSVGNFTTMFGMLVAFAFGYGALNNKFENMENSRSERTRQTDAKLAVLTQRLESENGRRASLSRGPPD
ncbi:hypothetical protein LUX29_12420 [Aureimonas altamirensis]|uniref:hypothetical protein n=1 Tax=Aureimonas altamirensis TaxID=370622 RepID=UPI001E389059|nr:hypothetical protein [Aureimonas altamirensis]UHD43894.1 hypothetical protein LUX29_12420 [Aureimonas altamirensis]